MKVVFICINDWASLSAKLSLSLTTVGIDSESYCLNKHPFNYDEESQTVSISTLRDKIQAGDVIIYSHGEISLLNQTQDLLKGKKVVVGYTGSAYRNAPQAHNDAFNPIVSLILTDQTEFMHLGAKNIHYIATAIDIKPIDKFGHEVKKPYKIGHFPSNWQVKGTLKILEMLEKVSKSFELLHSTENVSHQLQYKRMNCCDIYVELFKNELNGKPYGCWGVTAFEAAAAGKVVVTQNINFHVYLKVYRECPFIICNTEADFLEEVNKLLSMSAVDISNLQTATYNWVTEKHSYQATGEYLLNLLNSMGGG